MNRFDEQLKQAVRASSAPVPEAFLHRAEHLLGHLPRKERYVMKSKLTFGVVLTLVLCLLAAGAVAAVLLTGPELVEQQVLPMALENDETSLNDTFTHEELAHIAALAEENGIALGSRILQALEKGEGYWEEEVIMSLAKSQFGPYPGQWTLEEQHWFEEVVVAIGFKDYNRCRVPGEGDLPYETAYGMAKQYIADQGDDVSALDDRVQYALWRSYYADEAEDGAVEPPWWYFWFEPLDADLPEYIIHMDASGSLTDFQRRPGLAEALASGNASYYELYDMFYNAYGTFSDWTMETFIAFKAAVDTIDVSAGQQPKAVQAIQATTYILPPEGALSPEDAQAAALQAVNRPDTSPGCTVCILDQGRAVWKVLLYENQYAAWKIELDCITGEVLHISPYQESLGNWQMCVPQSVEKTIPTPNPEGNG